MPDISAISRKKAREKERKKAGEKAGKSLVPNPIYSCSYGTTIFPKKSGFLQKIGEKRSGLGKNSFAYRNWEM
ncbi:hypothetical protein JQN58_11405 [Aneurinibacillus sp. BA2021]|nr:hypothetical protein [Aneurinibacillus sp. BA2021]